MGNRKGNKTGARPQGHNRSPNTMDLYYQHNYKEGLQCDACQQEITRGELQHCCLQVLYDAFSDSESYHIYHAACAEGRDHCIKLQELFPRAISKQISALAYFLGNDSVTLLRWFRMIERICFSLQLEQEVTFRSDTKYKRYEDNPVYKGSKKLYARDPDEELDIL